MRKSLFLFLLSGALLLPCAAFAQSVYSDTYVIPVVSHTQGLGGSLWMSDVAITNFSSTPLNVELVVVESGATNMDNIYPLTTATNDGAITVPANATVVLRDVLNGHRGMTNTYGALILGGDKPFAVTSRLYNGGTGGNMVGQTVTPARDFFENSTGQADNAAVAYLPGLVSNASARTNIGFVAGSGSNAGASMNVEVRIKNAAGQTLGTRNFSIASGNFTHVQFSVASITTTPFDIGSAELRITSGEGTVVPYASVVDNASGNAAYIMGQFPPSTPFPTTAAFSRNLFRTLVSR